MDCTAHPPALCARATTARVVAVAAWGTRPQELPPHCRGQPMPPLLLTNACITTPVLLVWGPLNSSEPGRQVWPSGRAGDTVGVAGVRPAQRLWLPGTMVAETLWLEMCARPVSLLPLNNGNTLTGGKPAPSLLLLQNQMRRSSPPDPRGHQKHVCQIPANPAVHTITTCKMTTESASASGEDEATAAVCWELQCLLRQQAPAAAVVECACRPHGGRCGAAAQELILRVLQRDTFANAALLPLAYKLRVLKRLVAAATETVGGGDVLDELMEALASTPRAAQVT